MPSPPDHSPTRLVPIALAQLFGVACGVAGVKVNSHLLPPEILGHYGLFLTLAPLGVWVIHAGVVKFVARLWLGSTARPALFRVALKLWLRRLPWLALAAAAAAFVLASPPVRQIAIAWGALFPAAALLVLAAVAQAALQAERAHWRDCAVSVCGSVTRTFAPPLAFVVGGASLSAIWAGFGAHAVVFAAAGLLALHRYWRADRGTGPAPAPDAAYAGPLFAGLAAASWVLAGLNRWLVIGFFGEIEAGYFTLAGGAAVVLASTVGAVLVQYFQPGFFALGDMAGRTIQLARQVDRAAFGYTAAGLAVTGSFALVAPHLVGPLIDERYRGALSWILPAGCFGVATITTVFYQSLLLAGRRERACAPVELSTAGVLVLGGVAAAAAGRLWFQGWLLATPLVPWLLTRPLARHYVFRPDAAAAHAPGP